MKPSIRWKIFGALMLTLLVTICTPTAAQALPFNEIVVFGDSLSDSNLLLFEGQPLPDPELYYMGRLSNGPVWIEYLTDAEHFPVDLTDRAIAGARSEGLDPPGLVEQVSAYIVEEGLDLPATALFVIWIGGNDFLNGPGDYQTVLDNISEAMEQLVQRGALQLLVLYLPDLGAIPDTLGTPEAAEATAFSNNFNTGLGAMLDQFSVDNPDVALYEFEIEPLFVEVRSNPEAFGFVNASDPSPNFAVPDNFDGAGYVFWDEIHPTTEMHSFIADRVFQKVNAELPEDNPAVDDDDDDHFSCFINAMWWGAK